MDAHQVTRLTTSWLDQLPGEDSTVLSGYGVWPLLAILAELADGPARTELQAAAGSAYDGLLPRTPEVQAAVGLWTRPEVPLQPEVDKVIPAEARGVLTDKAALDRWVVEQTGGLLQRMPIDVSEDSLLVLASALAVTTKWATPFKEAPRLVSETRVRWLTRTDRDLETVRRHDTPGGPVSVITVAGTGEVDVRLVVGEPGRGRADVLRAGLQPQDAGLAGQALLDGTPSPAVKVIESRSPVPLAILSLPYFAVDAEHNLLDHAEVFGLETATDSTRGHFPGLSPQPLAISQAKQAVMAKFSATGFDAAAVTAMPAVAGSAARPDGKALLVDLTEPFGFIAVHRPTGIPLVTGWTTAEDRVPVA